MTCWFELNLFYLKGAFTYEGQMIDMPTVLQAENVLAIADK